MIDFSVDEMVKKYFVLTVGMFFIGWILYTITPKSFESTIGGYFYCANGGGVIFYWQVVSRAILAVVSFFMNASFFLSEKNSKNETPYKKISTSSLIFGFFICVCFVLYFADGILHYQYGCGERHSSWFVKYTISIFEMNIFHWILFFIFFEIIALCRRLKDVL